MSKLWLLPLMACQLVLIKHSEAVWDFSGSGGYCAEIYFNPRFQGPHVTLQDGEQASTLNTNNASLSFKIQEDCSLSFASRGGMKGKTTNVLESAMDFEGFEFIPKSAGCSCPKVCDCQTTKMRKRECARAYLETSCGNCDSYFTSLIDTGSDDKVYSNTKEFPSKWGHSVASILVRKGCSLQLQILKEGGIKENVQMENLEQGNGFNLAQQWESDQQITGYDCYCNSSLTSKRKPSNNSSKLHYPKMVTIPKSQPDLISLLSQPEMRSHPGVLAALQSLKNGRSPNTAYILLLGLTGSGKSTAINMLFDHPNITKVGEMSSTTTDIHEFTISVKSKELGIDNSQLRIIDTPGTSDTRGLTQDSRFLATLDKFLSNHQDLKNRVPNIVLIFSKFHDNRYHGDGAPFVKMLRTIEIFKERLIDSQYTNVIFVLSHYMSETKEITRNPTEKIESIRKVVEEFSTLPKPINIVVAENKPGLAQLPSLNGYYELPNGEFYPRNLFGQIQKTLLTAGDPIGESVIRQGFKNSDNFQIFRKTYPLVPETDPGVTKYFGIITSFDLPINSTAVSSLLAESYEHVSQELKTQYPGTLPQLQRSLYKRNIHGIENVPKTTPEILRLFRDIIQNPLSIFLLQSGLNLTVPSLGSHISVGYGYDLISDQPLSSPLFLLDEVVPSEIGFLIPKGFQTKLINRFEPIFSVFQDSEEYSKARLRDLGLQEGSVPLEGIKDKIKLKPGFNILEEGSQLSSLSAKIEYQMFQLHLGAGLSLTPEFLTAVDNLQPFNTTDYENVANWNEFFGSYGTHFVISAFGGGSIKIILRLQSSSSSPIERFAILNQAMSSTVQSVTDSLLGVGILDKNSSLPEGITSEIKIEGGDSSNVARELGSHQLNFDLATWKVSVHNAPCILSTYLELLPVSELVKLAWKSEPAEMISEAANVLFNTSLTYTPITRGKVRSSSREQTLSGVEAGIGNLEEMKHFSEIMKQMSDQTIKLQETFMKMIEQNKMEQERKDELEAQRRALDAQIRKEEEALRRAEENREEQRKEERYEAQLDRQAQLEALMFQKQMADAELQAKRFASASELQAQQQAQLFAFISAERDRQAQRKGVWDHISDFTGKIMQGLPALGMMMAG